MPLPKLTVPRSHWLQLAATWLFAFPFFTAGVAKESLKIQGVGLALLAVVSVAAGRRPLPRRAVGRICLTAATLTLISFAYLIFEPWPSSYDSGSSYNWNAMVFVIIYLEVAVFAALFFQASIFERVIWRAATVALWIGVACWLATRLTHHLLLVSTSHGVIRMQGTLSEPSAWAPVIPVVAILAIRRRSPLYMVLALVGMWLVASPTCLMVLVMSFVLYYALTGTRRHRVAIVLTLAVFIPASAAFVLTATPAQYLDSHNTAENAVGRLLAGIQNIDTDGRLGHNTRWTGTRAVVARAAENGWLLTGAGPGAIDTYARAAQSRDTPPLPYGAPALWVSVLFDFGVIGVAVLGVLMLTAVWRMRRQPELCAILLPFSVAALVNSAEGSFAFVFVALGIMLFAFNWAGPEDRCQSLLARSDESGVGDGLVTSAWVANSRNWIHETHPAPVVLDQLRMAGRLRRGVDAAVRRVR
jgi:hypothetical protein